MKLATNADIGVFVPAGVGTELEARWQHDLDTQIAVASSNVRIVEAHFDRCPIADFLPPPI